MAFWGSRLILTAVERGVFTLLAEGPLSAQALIDKLGWHLRAATTALDALVAAGLLRRDKMGLYSNTARTSLFLDRKKLTYIGRLMELSSRRLYDLWSGLDDLLETGVPGAEEERGDNEFFAELYADPDALRTFLAGMTGISTGEVTLLAARFPWKRPRVSSTSALHRWCTASSTDPARPGAREIRFQHTKPSKNVPEPDFGAIGHVAYSW